MIVYLILVVIEAVVLFRVMKNYFEKNPTNKFMATKLYIASVVAIAMLMFSLANDLGFDLLSFL
ncbi:hypothetical protein QE109_11395 [Fusibacter bizertensis]|uniref:Uncharacterized protein n=1 Tax=Fusibacter bizertensis TaxID=1488331 RepID=A0ABT6NEA6_9FIRM|nr:hypothetical protein [Fusibacter bizertensis]MDH8678757.1 hypothetical protein [Fusibacter bizertensis]